MIITVAEVARHEIGDDRAAAIGQGLVAAGEAFQHKIDVLRRLGLLDQIFMRAHLARVCRDVSQQRAIFMVQFGAVLQLQDQGIRQWMRPCCRGPRGTRGRGRHGRANN